MLEVAERPVSTPRAHRRRRRFGGLLLLVAVAAVAASASRLIGGSEPTSPGPYSAWVTWPAVHGASTVRIDVDGHLVDQIPADGSRRYQLHGLWPATTFHVKVTMFDSHGQVIGRYRHPVRTTRAIKPFTRLYSPSAFINRPIPPSPALAPNSAAMVADSLESQAAWSNLSNNAPWGIPIAYADAQSHRATVRCTTYRCRFSVGQVRIPAGAQANTGSDHHLVVLQPDGNELDMWVGLRTGSRWSAGTRWLESASGPAANCLSRKSCGGADAAFFALGAGVVRPEEIAQGHIDHALAITTPLTRKGYVACPAGHGDGQHSDPNALPIGAHLQLDPSVDVGALPIPRWQKVIAAALQRYGAYVVDTGGSVAIYAQSDLGRGFNAWAKAGVPSDSPHLTDLPWSSMRVLAMTRCAR